MVLLRDQLVFHGNEHMVLEMCEGEVAIIPVLVLDDRCGDGRVVVLRDSSAHETGQLLFRGSAVFDVAGDVAC